MRTLGVVAVAGIVAVLAACEQAPVAPERHAIEGRWQVVGLTLYRYSDGTPTTADLRDHAMTMEFKAGVYTSQGGLATYPAASPDETSTGTYIIIEKTRTIVLTAQSDAPGSRPETHLMSYGMSGDDKLDLLLYQLSRGLGPPQPVGTGTFHLERLDAN